ncbi:MAG TPA: glucose-6-phosphate isomerase [Gaiellaceae bacterium]|nr:glucose-6-phosphate isomerase [Gaiellaceae bacterium]
MPEPLAETAAWRRLRWHQAEIRDLHLRDLFAGDLSRGERLTASAAGLHLDFSKHRVTDDTLALLRKLAAERRLEEQVRAMFRGERVNVSEGRPALHVALRMERSRSLIVDGVDVVREVHDELDRLRAFAAEVRSGAWLGASGRPLRNVVNVGIGGSDLGPALAYEALRPWVTAELRFRFVANVDPAELAGAVRGLDPAETLFVVVSKTMSTLETLANAAAAREWLRAGLGPGADLARHVVGVAAATERAAAELRIPAGQVFRIWDWVGGRTSLCSAVGLSTLLALGAEGFDELLAGFRALDEHFLTTPLGANLPAICGLLAVWYRNFFGAETAAVIPYASALRLLPAYLQQLSMESLGKGVTVAGEPVGVETGQVLWGAEGTKAQHAVFQLLHQGTSLVPVDLIGFARPGEGAQAQHDLLAASLLAQAEALAFGRTEAELRAAGAPEETIPHRVMPGNRPTSVLLAERLTPATLGALIALYEHAVFTQAAVWGINPFDQWGVELGKELAARIAPELAADWPHELLHDSSTNALVRRYRQLRDRGG